MILGGVSFVWSKTTFGLLLGEICTCAALDFKCPLCWFKASPTISSPLIRVYIRRVDFGRVNLLVIDCDASLPFFGAPPPRGKSSENDSNNTLQSERKLELQLKLCYRVGDFTLSCSVNSIRLSHFGAKLSVPESTATTALKDYVKPSPKPQPQSDSPPSHTRWSPEWLLGV